MGSEMLWLMRMEFGGSIGRGGGWAESNSVGKKDLLRANESIVT